MADVTLLLGPVVFQDFEVPSGVNFGGRQRLVMHRLPGGSRVIDALGRDDAQISFSGIFSGSDATLRARSLDQLRVAGIALPLTWDVLFYTVLISEFQASYRSSWWIPYRIVCTVLRDEASELIQFAASLATTALADIGTASGYAIDMRVDLSPLQAALAAPGATTRGTAAYAAAQNCPEDGWHSIWRTDAGRRSYDIIAGGDQAIRGWAGRHRVYPNWWHAHRRSDIVSRSRNFTSGSNKAVRRYACAAQRRHTYRGADTGCEPDSSATGCDERIR